MCGPFDELFDINGDGKLDAFEKTMRDDFLLDDDDTEDSDDPSMQDSEKDNERKYFLIKKNQT